MQCDRAPDEISAFLDGELAEPQARDLGAHLRDCVPCAALLADYRRQGRNLKIAGREPLPEGLVARVSAVIAAERPIENKAMPSITGNVRPGRPDRRGLPTYLRQAAAMAAVCLLSVFGTWFVVADRNGQAGLERDVLSAHVRGLLQDSPVQVASSDQHTVRPWFTGRLEFSPEVKDLAGQGFPLVGGRLDYIDGHRAAVLVYRRQLHVINVFLSPAPGGVDSAPAVAVRNGYNLVHWTRGGVSYWAVSDLNTTELRQLQALL